MSRSSRLPSRLRGRPLALILTAAPASGPARTLRLSPAAFLAGHPGLAEPAARVLRSGRTECLPLPGGGSLYLARGLAD